MSDEAFPPECGHLGLACHAVMQNLDRVAMLAGDDDTWRAARFARVSPTLVIVEREGDHARTRPHHFVAYRVEAEAGETGTLDAGRVLFVVQERHFANPPDYHLQLIADPGEWFDEVALAIHRALEPFAPRAS